MVIDRDTGQTPPTAAERMAEHDRRMGHEPIRPAPRQAAAPPTTPSAPQQRMTPPPTANAQVAAAVADMNRKRPWKDAAKSTHAERRAEARAYERTEVRTDVRAEAQTDSAAQPARIAQRPAPTARGRKTIVTGKWWDAKGPRTIELGPKGQQTLSGGFVTLVIVGLVAALVTLLVQPVLLFIGAFLLFRFGGQILGPIGAGIVDKAIAEKN